MSRSRNTERMNRVHREEWAESWETGEKNRQNYEYKTVGKRYGNQRKMRRLLKAKARKAQRYQRDYEDE